MTSQNILRHCDARAHPCQNTSQKLLKYLDGQTQGVKRTVIRCGVSVETERVPGLYSGSVSPDPPISAGKSFILGKPSFIRNTEDS